MDFRDIQMREFSHYCLGNIEGCIEPSGAECNNTMSRCSECEIKGLIEYSTVQYSTVQYSTVDLTRTLRLTGRVFIFQTTS